MEQENLKNLIQENLNFLQNLSVPEYTLFRKWDHFNSPQMVKWIKKNTKKINEVKQNIWYPKNYNDFKDLNIKVIPAINTDEKLTWRILREYCHSGVWKSSPGRMGRFIVAHKEPMSNIFGDEDYQYKYLGIISIGSDFIGVGGRDRYIGWVNGDNKTEKLKHTCMGSSISPTQPLGFNYLGGKLIALMVCSDVIENFWNSKYKENLVGITTTSLYGGFSQYNNLKYWKKCKSSEGKVKLEPSENVYLTAKEWYKENYPEKYNTVLSGSHPKTKLLSTIYKLCGIKPPVNNAPRGVYFCSLFDNTRDFLNGQDNIIGNRKFDNSVGALSDIWKEKYANKRINKLLKDNRTNDNGLFYDNLMGIEWEIVRNVYLDDIGR